VLRLRLFGFDGLGAASNAAKWKVVARPPHGRRSRRAQVRCTHSGIAPSATVGHSTPTSPGGSYKTSYAVEVVVACLDGLVLTPVEGRGRGPPRHGAQAEVVATAGAEVVAARS
jgi:hypothetical protein